MLMGDLVLSTSKMDGKLLLEPSQVQQRVPVKALNQKENLKRERKRREFIILNKL